MDKQKLLSVVIPTKDRYKYLKKLIACIDTFDTNDLEIVLQDNTRLNHEIVDFLKEKDRPYIKYHHIEEQIPISQNVDLGIVNSSGEYICFIGDDDGILPNIVDCVRWMKAKSIDALRPSVVIYNWPDYLDLTQHQLSGALLYDPFSTANMELDCLASLKQLSSKGYRHIYTIPKVYQGIVKRSALDEVYKIGGTYSPGPSPDMATAVALCFTVKKFVTIDTPVIIVGQSHHVGGGERILKGGVKNIEDVPFLPLDAKQKWNSRIPKVWCSQTVWPESAISALRYMGKEDAIPADYDFILAWFIHTHPADKHLAYALTHNKLKVNGYLLYFSWGVSIKRTLFGFLNVLRGKKRGFEGRTFIKRDLSTINDAVEFLKTEHAKDLVFDIT